MTLACSRAAWRIFLTESSMKICVLATDSQSTWLTVNAIACRFPDVKVVLEQPVSRATLLRRRAERLGWWPAFGQLLFMVLLPLLKREARAKVQALLAASGLSPSRRPDLIAAEVASVNSTACMDWLRTEQPDVVVLNGTRIVSHAVLACCEAVFLNTHCGITPKYRGVHGGYWAFATGDVAHAGVTVHVVDSGIDTGGVIYQGTIERDAADNFCSYPVRQYLVGIPLMLKALQDVADGALCTRASELPSCLWFHPTIWQYLHGRFVKGVK